LENINNLQKTAKVTAIGRISDIVYENFLTGGKAVRLII
jgi:hypothetical protein